MTAYETYLDGNRERFETLTDAENFMTAHGLVYEDSRACDHPTEERSYWLPAGAIDNYANADEAFADLYGDGNEPTITPIEA